MKLGAMDLRGDLRRFGLILACLALGTSIVAAVGSIGSALRHSVDRDAIVLAGGDLEASPLNASATPSELAFLETLGEVTRVLDTTALGWAGDNHAMVDLLAVSDNYPAAGSLVSPQLAEGVKPAALLSRQNGVFGAVADHRLLEKLGIGVGGRFRLGETSFEVRGTVSALPDGAVRGFQLGYPALISIAAYDTMADLRTPLPGLLTHDRYKIRLTKMGFDAAAAAIEKQFEGRNWRIRSPREVAGDLSRYYDLFGKFTLIVALSSLLIGGVGVSNGVTAYVAERRRAIAVLRSLGATGSRVVVHFMTQIGVITLAGVTLGLTLGTIAALLALPMLGRMLGANLPPTLEPGPLLAAAGFGFLVSFAFSYLPLMQARRVSAAMLFRSEDVGGGGGTARLASDWAALWPVAIALSGVFGLAVLLAGDAFVVGLFSVGAALTILLLRAAAWLLQNALRRLPPLPFARARMALRSIGRPGAPAAIVILSIGLGLAVLLIVTLLGTNLRDQLLGAVRRDAPSFVIPGLFEDEAGTMREMSSRSEFAAFYAAPMVQAEVISINGTDPKTIRNIPEEAEFMLTGSIPVTWAEAVPPHSVITNGAWWSPGYRGPPLVSLRDTMEFQLGLKVGDTLQLSIAGEAVNATIGSFRHFEWEDGSNLMVTFSPGAIDFFPSTYMAVVKAAAGQDDKVEQLLLQAFPDVTLIPVGDALDQAAAILDGLGQAVRAVAILAVLNGILVLAGTAAAGRKQREADAIVHKVLGATRADVLSTFVLEYGLLSAIGAIIGSCAGIAVAWAITRGALEVPFVADPVLILQMCIGAIVATIAVGAATTWRALSTRPGQALRDS